VVGRTLWRHRGRLQALGLAAATAGRGGFVRGRVAAAGLAGVVIAIALPFVLPWTFRAAGDVVVEAAPRARVHAAVPGILDGVRVAEGDTVGAGEPLATIWSPELLARATELEGRVGRHAVEEARAQAAGDRSAAGEARAELESARAGLARIRSRLDAALVRAPIEGVVVAPRLRERVGESVAEGSLLLEVASLGRRAARVHVPVGAARNLAVGQRANLKFPTWPGVVFVSRVASVAPAAREGWVEATVPIAGGPRLPAPGATGRAKLVTERGTVAEALGRAGRRLVRLDLWI
jgi:multidrug resistance efflux pump